MLTKGILITAAVVGTASHAQQPSTLLTNWLPFIGTVVAAILTAGVAYLAYRRSRRSEDKQERLQGEVSVLRGFNDLTTRLQEQVEYNETQIAHLNKEVNECNRDRVQLRILIEKQRAEVDMLKHLVLPDAHQSKD